MRNLISFMSMKNLGDKLKDARTALSLSVRDVADATRLRSGIIENMEEGKFDYSLPEIYKRGFLRIYAAFLKMDTAAVMAEYESLTRTTSREDSSFMHRLQRTSVHKDTPSPAPSNDESRPSIESRYEDETEKSSEKNKIDEDTLRYMKLGGLFVGLILAAVVIVLIVSSLVKSGNQAPQENPDIAGLGVEEQTSSVDVSNVAAVPQGAEKKKTLHLAITALEDTYVLAYPENDQQKLLISGPMQQGERREFDSDVPIMLKLTDAERVKLERNSKQIDIGGARGLKRFKITPQ